MIIRLKINKILHPSDKSNNERHKLAVITIRLGKFYIKGINFFYSSAGNCVNNSDYSLLKKADIPVVNVLNSKSFTKYDLH